MKYDWNKDGVLAMAESRIINYSGDTLCANYRNPLEKCVTASQAIRLYKNCISWALLERYPTKEDLLSFASKETLAKNGVYIDMEFSGERIDSHVCCVFVNCKGRVSTGLNVDKEIIPMMYLSDGCDIEFKVDDFLNHPIPVELYYGSKATGTLLSVKDCNHLTAKDNVGFTPEQQSVLPNLNNEQL